MTASGAHRVESEIYFSFSLSPEGFFLQYEKSHGSKSDWYPPSCQIK